LRKTAKILVEKNHQENILEVNALVQRGAEKNCLIETNLVWMCARSLVGWSALYVGS
jgi:hypothetical protein